MRIGRPLAIISFWALLTSLGSAQAQPASTSASPTENPKDDLHTAIENKLREWNLDPDRLVRELERAGRILREKTQEAQSHLREEWPDIRIIATVKGRLLLDPHVDGWAITVGCEDGRVRLSGTVNSPEELSRAIVIALDVPGVTEVESTLRVNSPPSRATPPARPNAKTPKTDA